MSPILRTNVVMGDSDVRPCQGVVGRLVVAEEVAVGLAELGREHDDLWNVGTEERSRRFPHRDVAGLRRAVRPVACRGCATVRIDLSGRTACERAGAHQPHNVDGQRRDVEREYPVRRSGHEARCPARAVVTNAEIVAGRVVVRADYQAAVVDVGRRDRDRRHARRGEDGRCCAGGEEYLGGRGAGQELRRAVEAHRQLRVDRRDDGAARVDNGREREGPLREVPRVRRLVVERGD